MKRNGAVIRHGGQWRFLPKKQATIRQAARPVARRAGGYPPPPGLWPVHPRGYFSQEEAHPPSRQVRRRNAHHPGAGRKSKRPAAGPRGV